MTTAGYLLAKHSGGAILIDTKPLLLLFVGNFKRDLIATFKRLNTFTAGDYDTLVAVLRFFRKIVTTPNILTEVSNLSGELRDQTKAAYFASFSGSLSLLDENYIRSAAVSATPCFGRFGLTDAGVAFIAGGNMLVLTDDLPLYGYLSAAGINALNFNHLRSWNAA